MVKIIGVDFSGAKERGKRSNTWITEGTLEEGQNERLRIICCESISRSNLAGRLKKRDYSVAAMDFPFSVPIAFARYWKPDADKMPDLWCAASKLNDPEQFKKEVNDFAPAVADEVLRVGDMHVPGCYSCLHRAQPNMVPMTFEGMKLLHTLTNAGRYHIPPLPRPRTPSPVLLEVMPGAALAAFGMPDKGYKGGTKANQLRKEILNNLSHKSGISLPNLSKFCDRCLKNDNALDSLVAAVVAALWHNKKAFHTPSNKIVSSICRPTSTRWASSEALGMRELEAARKEGWIYVPECPKK